MPYTIKTKLIIRIEIDTTGKVINPIVLQGINESIDKKVIEIFKEMPEWKPAYQYGKLTRQIFTLPVLVDYK